MRNFWRIALYGGLSILSLYADGLRLSVDAKGFENGKGHAIVMLYNRPGSIPDKSLSHYYRRTRVAIHDGSAHATFTNLPAGNYAVSLFHDANDNGKLDKGMIFPVEGVGLSRFDSLNPFNPPSFEKASFTLDKNSKIAVRLLHF
jgi:uncharacterized protein (DUF2141 family)